ncbi:hypothetical protein FO519_004917 [Halicephalobus sp. NKZ332]|nr:hypothetical protein FO519_004917 [Halicephalobus sp. NKZ332]
MWMVQKPRSMVNFFIFLMKLPGFYPLLIKEFSDKVNNPSPLSLTLELLNSSMYEQTVKNKIIDGVYSLLTTSDDTFLVSDLPESKIKIRDGFTFGMEIVLKFLPSIIEFLMTNIPTDANQAKKLPNVYLDILNKLSPYVEDTEVGKHFASTLLAYVEFGKIKNDEKAVSILHSVCELVGFVDDPRSFLKMVKMVSSIGQRGPRVELVKLVQAVSNHKSLKSETSLVKSLNIFVELESFNKRHLEDPDYERRYDALSVLSKIYISGEEKLDPLAIAFFARSHAYALTIVSDIALRSSSMSAFCDLITYIPKVFPDDLKIRQELLRKNLVPLISSGLRSPKDTVRDDFAKGLDLLVTYFSEDEKGLLRPLKDLKNENPDEDFFLNVTHIQQHKRIKAFKSLGDRLSDGSLSIPIESISKKNLEIEKKEDEPANEEEIEDIIDENTANEKQKDDPNVILEALLSTILPTLKKCLRSNPRAIGHKYSQTGKVNDSEELKRAPIALATVKLLQKLPSFVLDQHLHGVILTLLNLLGSRANDVRSSARKNLDRIVQSLGVKFLPFVVKELRGTLNKGFRIHVMIFTVHHLIAMMEPLMKTGDLDACLEDILEVCNQEQFSDVTEEKDMPANVIEAKSNKTSDTYEYLGRFISCGMLMKVITPMKDIIDTKPSSTTMGKLGNLLKSFANGLRMNNGIEPSDLLQFSYLVLTNYLEEMMKQVALDQAATDAEEKERKEGYRPESCFLIPVAPKRMGVIIKTSVKSKSAIFVEFGVNLLGGLLKAKVFSVNEEADIERLNPFLELVLQCLKLKYEKIVGASLKCLVSLLKFKLPATEKNQKELIERLFVVLADYSATEKVGELRTNIFKSITTLIHTSSNSILTKKRVQILLNYAEADVIDNQRQSTAFALIKVILNKVVKDEKIVQMMDYLGEISITSSLDHIRKSAREMMLIYITLYKLSESEIEKWLTFYLEQLEYEGEDGRLSALEMTNLILNAMTEETCSKFSLFTFIKLAARIANDESKKCVKFVLLTIRKLIQSTTEKSHIELISVTKDWISAEKEGTRIIGCKVLNELIKNLPNLMTSRLEEYLDILISIFDGMKPDCFSENLVLNIFETMTTMCQLLPEKFIAEFVTKKETKDALKKMNEFLKCTISKEIQVVGSGFFGQLLGCILSESKEGKKLKKMMSDSVGFLEIVYSMCFIMKNQGIQESTVDQAIRNLIALSSVIEEEEFEGFIHRVLSICTKEVTKFKNQSLRRIGVFKMTAAVALKSSESRTLMLATNMMPFLYRPDFWGLVNKHWKMCTVGQLQSPINVDPSRLLFDPGLTPIHIGSQQVEAVLQNTGQLPIITVNESFYETADSIQLTPRIVNVSGGPAAPYNYRLHHVVFHFGRIRDGEKGSEHTVDRVRFPAELQLLAYNYDLYENFSQAMTEPKGLLGISIIVDIGEVSNVELRKLTVASQSVTYKNSKTTLTRFHPSELMPRTINYVTYEGSLTYPGCYETVTWIVMNNPIYITKEDLSIWNDLQQTEIKQTNPVFMSPNYRPLKPLNNRLIRTNINIKASNKIPGVGSCPSNIYLNNGYRANPLKVKNGYSQSKSVPGARHARRTKEDVEEELGTRDLYDQAYAASELEIETSY